MTLGLGIDLVDVAELRDSAERQPDKYLQRIFTVSELAYAGSQSNPIQCLAGKLAAKEACMKAFGTGWSDEIDWQHIEVLNTDEGPPYLAFYGGAARRFEILGCKSCRVSISHLPNVATSVVLLED